MLRDFSDAAKQKLLNYVDEVTANGTWDKVKEWFSNIEPNVQSWLGRLDIQKYVNSVECYYKKILDKNNSTKRQIEEIFSNVQAVDTRYISITGSQTVCGSDIIKLINDLANTIDPNGGNMDMGKMKGVLDADVENIRNAKATVEKTIEEKMLGTEAEGCMNSEDPVNLSTGNFIYEHEDLKVGGEIPLSFHRYYNSKDRRSGVLGDCFLHNYQTAIEKEENGAVRVRQADGQVNHYDRTVSENGREELTGRNTALESLKETETGYVLEHPGTEIISFDGDGKMLRKEDRNGRGISFSYLEGGKLEKAEADNGSSLTYSYNKEGQLEKVTDHTGRSVQLAYREGKLEKVTTASGAEYRYAYGENGRITEVENARRVTAVKNTYDRRFRIIRQEFPDGGTMEFSYDDKNRLVTLTERNGSRIIHVHDERYRNTETIYEDGTKEHYLYNEKNQCISMTDRLGRTTRMAYDNRGNLTQTVDALKRRVNYTYDAGGHLTSISINGKERLKNHYDKKGNLTGTENLYGNSVVVKNDEAGRPEEVIYADGSFLELGYDERGNLTQIRDMAGGVTAYGYDAANRVTETVDANGNVTRYSYDEADRVTAVTDAMGNRRTYTYNAGGKIETITDFDGMQAAFTYNPLGKVETYTDKEGHRAGFAYDRMWNISSVTAPDGGIRRYEYDGDSRLVKQVLPMGGEISYAYDAAGNRTGMTDAAGNTTRYRYDAVNRLTGVTGPDGAETVYEYDREGNLIKETNACGQTTCYTYDALGRRTSVTDAAGATTSVFYNEMGKAERICHPNGSSTIYGYEKGGRLKSVRYPDGAGEDYSYDAKGNLTGRATTAGERYCYGYDCLDRIISIENPAGGVAHFTYDALGRVTEAEDENGNVTSYEYTPNGNLAKVTDALGNETFYQYDAMGHLTQSRCTGADGEEPQDTVYTWDKEGHVLAVTDPMGDMERYTYDPAGRLAAKTDKDGYETSFRYGKDGQVEEIRYADGRSVSLTYNAMRQLEEVKDWLGTTRIAMDGAGRTASVTDPYGKTVGYEWGSMGERTAVLYPDGRKAAYEYNGAMQLTAMQVFSGEKQEQTVRYSYDEAGRLAGKQFPGGSTEYKYNSLGRISELRHSGKDVQIGYQYEYDKLGNKVRTVKERNDIIEDNGCFDYAYDGVNRLIQVRKDGKLLRNYTYDAFGNRSSKTEYQTAGELTTTYHYNTKNQLVQEKTANATKDYAYDHRGNLLSVTSGGEVLRAYEFDAANQMSSSMGEYGGIVKKAEYQYNGLGHRMNQKIWKYEQIQPENPEHQIQYTLDLTRQYYNLLQKEDSYTETVTDKTPESGIQSFYWDRNVVSMEADGIQDFYLQDDLGSPVNLVNQDGQSIERYAYDEFGMPCVYRENKVSGLFAGSAQPFGFNGYQMDEAGGLYFAQARRYDANIGRFVSADIMRGGIAFTFTLNRYNYCWNKPTELQDLNGMWVTIAAGAVVGGLIGGGLEIYDQYKNGTLEWSWKSVGKIAVSTLQGAGEGAALGTGNVPAAAVTTFVIEIAGGYAKDAIDGKNLLTLSEFNKNIGNATINTAITLLSGKFGEALGKIAPKLSQKFAPHLRNLISHDEIFQDGMADWLFKYAGSGADDAKEAMKLLGQYIGAESLYDMAVNRINSFGDSLLDEVLNGTNLSKNLKPNKEEKE